MPCECKPSDDVRAVCAFKTTDWKTCPVKYNTAVFYIDNDCDHYMNARSYNFSFLTTLVDDDVITQEDAHNIVYHWTKDWIENEYDSELEQIYQERRRVIEQRIKNLKQIDQQIKDLTKDLKSIAKL